MLGCAIKSLQLRLQGYFFYTERMEYELLPGDHQHFMLKVTAIIYNSPWKTWVWFQNWSLGWQMVGQWTRCQKTNVLVSDLLKWYLLHSQILTPGPIKKMHSYEGHAHVLFMPFSLLPAPSHLFLLTHTDTPKSC